MTTSPSAQPAFTHILRSQLPPHVVQSDDLQYLTCRKCSTSMNLNVEPNYKTFIWEHAHIPPPPKAPQPKPWPSYPE